MLETCRYVGSGNTWSGCSATCEYLASASTLPVPLFPVVVVVAADGGGDAADVVVADVEPLPPPPAPIAASHPRRRSSSNSDDDEDGGFCVVSLQLSFLVETAIDAAIAFEESPPPPPPPEGSRTGHPPPPPPPPLAPSSSSPKSVPLISFRINSKATTRKYYSCKYAGRFGSTEDFLCCFFARPPLSSLEAAAAAAAAPLLFLAAPVGRCASFRRPVSADGRADGQTHHERVI